MQIANGFTHSNKLFRRKVTVDRHSIHTFPTPQAAWVLPRIAPTAICRRSEEHTSELQSPCNLVCRLLLEKKKRTLYRERERHAYSTQQYPVVQNSSTHPQTAFYLFPKQHSASGSTLSRPDSSFRVL